MPWRLESSSVKKRDWPAVFPRPGLMESKNAQDEDQEQRQETFQGDRDRQGALCPARQAPWHDQADQQADPQSSRDERAVQVRRRQRQEVFLAERLRHQTTSFPRSI